MLKIPFPEKYFWGRVFHVERTLDFDIFFTNHTHFSSKVISTNK